MKVVVVMAFGSMLRISSTRLRINSSFEPEDELNKNRRKKGVQNILHSLVIGNNVCTSWDVVDVQKIC